jgi:thioredoxin 1
MARQPRQQKRAFQLAYVTAMTLDRLLRESSTPIVVSFQTPQVEALVQSLELVARAFEDTLHVLCIDVRTHPDLAVRFGIRVVPTLLFFKMGVPVEFIVGPVPTRFMLHMARKICSDKSPDCPGQTRVGIRLRPGWSGPSWRFPRGSNRHSLWVGQDTQDYRRLPPLHVPRRWTAPKRYTRCGILNASQRRAASPSWVIFSSARHRSHAHDGDAAASAIEVEMSPPERYPWTAERHWRTVDGRDDAYLG